MAVSQGRTGKLMIGANTAAYIQDWSFNENIGTVETTSLQDTARVYENTIDDPEISVSGYFDSTDTVQSALHTAALAGDTTVSGCKLYINATKYYTLPNTALMTDYSQSASVDGLVTFSCTIKAGGTVTFT